MEAYEGLYAPGDAASFFVLLAVELRREAWPVAAKSRDRSCFSLGIYSLPAGSGGAVLGVSGPLVGLNYTNIIKFYETLHAVRKPVNKVQVNDIY